MEAATASASTTYFDRPETSGNARISSGRGRLGMSGVMSTNGIPQCLALKTKRSLRLQLLTSSSHALALGRLDTVSYQWVKWANSGAIFISAKRAPKSIATKAVMSAIVKRSPATN